MPTMTPTSVDVDRKQGIRLAWPDGKTTAYSLETLRKSCPCATCKEERAKEATERKPLLKVLTGNFTGDLILESVELVGNYALKLTWTDGHNTGIYSFTYLRDLAGEL